MTFSTEDEIPRHLRAPSVSHSSIRKANAPYCHSLLICLQTSAHLMLGLLSMTDVLYRRDSPILPMTHIIYYDGMKQAFGGSGRPFPLSDPVPGNTRNHFPHPRSSTSSAVPGSACNSNSTTSFPKNGLMLCILPVVCEHYLVGMYMASQLPCDFANRAMP